MIRIKVRSEGAVTFKTAAHIATELAKGIIAPITAQIDPMHAGEVSRALKIGAEYGKRLDLFSMNLQEDSLERLVEGYPSHGFVIDRNEATELFIHVRDASDDEKALIRLGPLRWPVRIPNDDDTMLSFLSEPQKETGNDSNNAQNAGGGGSSEEERNTSIAEISGSEESAGFGRELYEESGDGAA